MDNPFELTITFIHLYFIFKKNSDVKLAEYQFQNKICVLLFNRE
jgi:hypothetical protein